MAKPVWMCACACCGEPTAIDESVQEGDGVFVCPNCAGNGAESAGEAADATIGSGAIRPDGPNTLRRALGRLEKR